METSIWLAQTENVQKQRAKHNKTTLDKEKRFILKSYEAENNKLDRAVSAL